MQFRMLRSWRRGMLAFSVVGISLTLASCSKPDSTHHKTRKVEGQLFVNGKPAKDAMVRLVSTTKIEQLNPNRSSAVASTGRVDADGNFKISTHSRNDGVPVGHTFNIAITWNKEGGGAGPMDPDKMFDGPDRLNDAYKNAMENAKKDSDTFTVVVDKGDDPVVIPKIDLEVEGLEVEEPSE